MAPADASAGAKPAGAESVFVHPAQLKSMLGQPGLKVIDVRSASAYAKGHIAGAISIPWNAIQVPERDGLRNKWADDAVIEKVFAQAGLSYDDAVVLYDQGSIGAGIIFAIFTYAGFDKLRVLDGGFGAWEGSIDSIPVKPAGNRFVLSRKNGDFLVGKEFVAARIGDPKTAIVEGRVSKAYEDGHIPTAKHVDPATHLEKGKFLKPRDILLENLSSKGVTQDKQIILYCGSGGAAARNFMVLKELGFKNVAIYLNAWDEWSIDPAKGQELGVTNVAFSGGVINRRESLGPRFFGQAELKSALDQKSVLVLDVRSAADFNIGRIAGSVNVYWDDTLGPDRNPKRAEELAAMFEQKGVTRDRHIVVFTRGGVQLAYMYTLLKLLGYPQVSAYNGRWDGWEIPSWKAVSGK